MKQKIDPAVKQKFIELIGKKWVDDIIENEWVEFKMKTAQFYGPEKYEMAFLERDGKRDTVIFLDFVYDGVIQKWVWDSGYTDKTQFDTFADLLACYQECEDGIVDNGTTFVDFAPVD